MNDTISDLVHIGIYAVVFCTAVTAFMLLIKFGKTNVDALERDNMQKSSVEMDYGEKDAMTGFASEGMDALGGIYADKPISRQDVYADILSLTDRYDEDDLEKGSPVIVQIDRSSAGKDRVVITSYAKQDTLSEPVTPTGRLPYNLLDLHNREKGALYHLLNDLAPKGTDKEYWYQRHYVYNKNHELTHVNYVLQKD